MAPTPNNWRVEFMLAHPRLFDFMQDEPKDSFGYPLCNEGWRDVLERLCGRIEESLRDNETFELSASSRSSGSCVLAGNARSRRRPGPASKRPSRSPGHAAAARARSAAWRAISITLPRT